MSDLNTYNIYALSERAAVIDLGNTIDELLNNRVLAMYAWLQEHPFTGLKDMVAAYSSLTVLYDPFVIHSMHSPVDGVFNYVKSRLEVACLESDNLTRENTKTVSIPVCYDDRFGYDLKLMAAAKNISADELIHIHCDASYRVYMLGFLPGFAYMGRVNERLVMPRRSVPREQVEAGSVGIAGWQTGIYPVVSPGGWQIIGRTPINLFDAYREPPVILSAGDEVQFYPISFDEFKNYQAANNVVNHH